MTQMTQKKLQFTRDFFACALCRRDRAAECGEGVGEMFIALKRDGNARVSKFVRIGFALVGERVEAGRDDVGARQAAEVLFK